MPAHNIFATEPTAEIVPERNKNIWFHEIYHGFHDYDVWFFPKTFSAGAFTDSAQGIRRE